MRATDPYRGMLHDGRNAWSLLGCAHGFNNRPASVLLTRPYRSLALVDQERYPHRFTNGGVCRLCSRPIDGIESDVCQFWTGGEEE